SRSTYCSIASRITQCGDRRRAAASRCTRSFVSISSFKLVVAGFGMAGAPRCYLVALYHSGVQAGNPAVCSPSPATARSGGEVGISMPVGDEFRMLTAEGLGDVAVPADGLVGGKNHRNLLGPELVPLSGGVIGSQQGWWMIEMLDALERFVAIDAVLAFAPVRHDIPDQAILGIGFDLLQALLAAVLALGPAGATVQMEGGLAD